MHMFAPTAMGQASAATEPAHNPAAAADAFAAATHPTCPRTAWVRLALWLRVGCDLRHA